MDFTVHPLCASVLFCSKWFCFWFFRRLQKLCYVFRIPNDSATATSSINISCIASSKIASNIAKTKYMFIQAFKKEQKKKSFFLAADTTWRAKDNLRNLIINKLNRKFAWDAVITKLAGTYVNACKRDIRGVEKWDGYRSYTKRQTKKKIVNLQQCVVRTKYIAPEYMATSSAF